MLLLALSCIGGCSGPYSTLDPAGPAAAIAARLWWAMFSFFGIVLLALTAVWLYAQFLRQHATSAADSDPHDTRAATNRWIIGGGIVLPLASIAALLAFGVPAGHRMLMLPFAPDEVLRIEVTGHQWWWDVHYPDSGIRLRDELHIPAGRPVELHLRSADVIHSFWVPRLGGKLDLVPGRTNVLRLMADSPGTYAGQCAEFCGLLHAHMHFRVEAHAPDAFILWLDERSGD
jgi:cytochrome c oxidase subunit II